MANATTSSESLKHFEPLVIIVFGPKTLRAAKQWLIYKLRCPQTENGAELIVRTITLKYSRETVLYIGATIQKLLIEAESMKIKKTYHDGTMKEILLSNIDKYVDSDDLDSFLTTAEKQGIILRCIESLKPLEGETNIPGYNWHILRPNQRIILRYINGKLITNFFPLHEPERLKVLKKEWYSTISKSQPMDKIQEYFGVKIALYFAFMGFYTISLLPPALIGILFKIIGPSKSMYHDSSFAIFNMIWTTIFLEGWKRHCNALCYKWGTINTSIYTERSLIPLTVESRDSHAPFNKEPRPAFHGKPCNNPVTGQPDWVYPIWKRVAKFYLVSVPIMILSLTVGVFTMLGFFWFRNWWMLVNYPVNRVLALVPTLGYNVITMSLLKTAYEKIALVLTRFENHKYQAKFENHLILKLILFEFFNKFMSLFYVAFYLQDRHLLKELLGMSLVLRYISIETWKEIITFLFLHWRQSAITSMFTASIPDLDISRSSSFITNPFYNILGMIWQITDSIANHYTRLVRFVHTMSTYICMTAANSYCEPSRPVTSNQDEEPLLSEENLETDVVPTNQTVSISENVDVNVAHTPFQSIDYSADVDMVHFQTVDVSYRRQAALEGEMEKHPCYVYERDRLPTRKGLIESLFTVRKKPFNEYLDVMTQFCYIYLFSSVIPYAAVWGVINNFIEIRLLALKLCKGFQRPFTESVNSIGIWQSAFEIIGLISVMTNCALIALDPDLVSLLPSDTTAVNMVLIFVACEHLVFAIKAGVAVLVPDVPKWVRLQIAKQEYEERMDSKRQRLLQSDIKKNLVSKAFSRRFSVATAGSTNSIKKNDIPMNDYLLDDSTY